MAKQLNVSLAFTADTGKAKAQLQDLQRSLTELLNTSASGSATLGLDKQFKEATAAAAQLKAQLSQSVSSNGLLDLTKFNQSLKNSGMSLEQYRKQLSALGPEGSQAFSKLASSISTAEVPIQKANGALQQFGTTLMNTARWQISSSILHGFMGAVQGAIGYAEDLNKSLNNIRIVTGMSTDQMAQFAEQANKAAQALSTRTTDYTDAALIYYQQGIRDQNEIAERTETTLKLANVSRQSAQQVSDQMTAIWNNFDDGTQSLEYYADVITALGASTASSSEEISKGLEKFAAVADTVGLSYENAAAAVATIVAETRQSADTVGTGLRTLFSRLQSLKLGETLEDGVSLSKYSAALESVGVKVLDINNEVRSMDDILGDLGAKWNDISDSQQIALAQTVGGVRQYTNLIALMDNWNKMQQNVGIASGSKGTLQEQQDIYAESWEASAKRVKAAAEEIYQAILDDNFFIDFNDVLAESLESVNNLIKGLGGIPGVLSIIGALLTKMFSAQMTANFDKMAKSISMRKNGTDLYEDTNKKAILELQKEANEQMAKGSLTGMATSQGLNAQASLQEKLLGYARLYNEEQTKTAQILLDQNATLRQEAIEAGKLADSSKKASENQKRAELNRAIQAEARRKIPIDDQDRTDAINNIKKQSQELENLISTQAKVQSNFTSFEQTLQDSNLSIEDKISKIKELYNVHGQELQNMLKNMKVDPALASDLENIINNLDGSKLQSFQTILDDIGNSMAANVGVTAEALAGNFRTLYGDTEKAEQAIERLMTAFENDAEASAKLKEALEILKNSTDGAGQKMDEMAKKAKELGPTFGQQVSAVSQFAMSFASIINTVKGAIDTLNNEDMTFGEKMLAIIPSLLMSFSMLTSAMSGASGAALLAAAGHIPLIGNLAATTAAEVGATGATLTLGVALSSLLPILGAIGVAVTAVSFALKAWDDTHYTFAEQMEDAKNAAEHASKAAEDTKQKYTDLASAAENYQSVIDTLNSCTSGTQEWRDALKEAGEATSSLIDQFPELQKFYDNASGLIDTDALNEYVELAKKQAMASEFQSIYIPTWQQRIQKNQTLEDANLQQQWHDSYGLGGDNSQTISTVGGINVAGDFMRANGWLSAGSDLSSSLYESLTFQGENFKNFLEGAKDIIGNNIYNSEEDYYNALQDYILNSGKNYDYNIDDMVYDQIRQYQIDGEDPIAWLYDSAADLLKDNSEDTQAYRDIFNSAKEALLNNIAEGLDGYVSIFKQLADQQEEYEGSLKDATKRIIDMQLANVGEKASTLEKAYMNKVLREEIARQSEYSKGLQDTFIKGSAMDATGATQSIRVQDAYYMRGTEGVAENGNRGGLWQKKITDEYLRATGLGSTLTYANQVGGNDDSNRTYGFYDSSQNGEIVWVSIEEMASAITLFNSGIENFNSIIEQASAETKKFFGELSPEFNDALGNLMLSGNFNLENIKSSEIQSQFALENRYGQKLSSMQTAQLYYQDLENQGLDLAKTFGVSKETILDAIASGIDDYKNGLQDLSNKFKSNYLQDAFNDLQNSIGDSTLAQQNELAEQLSHIYVQAGHEGVDALNKFYQDIGDNFDEIDFSSIDSLEEFSSIIKNNGEGAKYTSDELSILYNNLCNVAQSTGDASTEIAEINKIISKLGKGSTISKEDYDKLGSDITDGYFTIMADGTYALTKDAEQFAKHVNNININKLIEEGKSKIQEQQQLSNTANSFDSVAGYANSAKQRIVKDVDISGNKIFGYDYDEDVLREQIDLLGQLGKIGPDEVQKYKEALEDGNEANEEFFNEIKEKLLELEDDWESLKNITKDGFIPEEEIMKIMSISKSVPDLINNLKKAGTEWANESGGIFEGFDDEQLKNFAKQWVQMFSDGSNISTLEEYKEAIKSVGEEAGLTAEEAQKAWENMDLSTLTEDDLSYVQREFEAGRMSAETFKAAIEAILDNSSPMTTAEKIQKLLNLLGQGSATAKQFADTLQSFLKDENIVPQEKLNFLDNNEENIKSMYFEKNIATRKMSSSQAETKANNQYIQDYVDLINDLQASDFKTPEAFIEFFDRLPEGVNYTDKLNSLFKDMASSITNFDQLDKFGELMTANGATQEDLQDENGAYQTARQSAIDSSAKEIGVSSEELSNYTDSIREIIVADNELRQVQAETAEGMQKLDNLCLKMAKSMMEQEKGYEDLKSATKKYSQELAEFLNDTDTLSKKSNAAITAVQQAVSKLFGTKVSRKFIEENLEDIKDAAENGGEALQKLQRIIAKDYVHSLQLAQKDTVKLRRAQEEMFESMSDVEIGDDISDDFRNTLNQMLADGTITVDQLEGILNSMGYDVNMDGMTMAVDNAREIISQFGPMLSEGINIASAEFGQAMAGLSGSARAELQALVQDFMAAGMDAGQAYNAAINSIQTELEVHDKEISMQDQADATSHSHVELSGDITATADDGPGTSTHYSGGMDIDTTTNAAGDGDIHLPTLGKGGAAYNGGGAGAGARSGGGGGRGGCFAAGTLITTLNGYKKIEDIQKGDIVLSYNEDTMKNEYSEVMQTMIHLVYDNIYTLYIEDERLVVTGIHKFLITRFNQQDWIQASELRVGDLVLFADGTLHFISQINIEKKAIPVYNFEVSNNHNYYVGYRQILAHNKGGGCFIAGTSISTLYGFKNIEDIKIGDIVLSYNEYTNRNEYSEVLQTMMHLVYEDIYTLYIENESITATGIHRFLICRNGIQKWIKASHLQIGDLVFFADGTWHAILNISMKIKAEVVYNFEVSGNHNYYVGQNQILAHNKGGGGGKAKTPQKKDLKKSSDEIERYHKVKAELKDLTDNYERIGKAKDKAFGPDRIRQLNREIDAQNKMIKKQKEYIKEIEKYHKADKKAIESYGAQFDSMGNISNYDQIMQQQLDKYNAVLQKYNSMSAEEQESEETKKMLEEAEKAYEDFKKILQQYEETNELLQEQQEELNDQIQHLYDLSREKIEYVVQIRLDYDDSVADYLDYLRKQIAAYNDDLDATIENVALFGKRAENIMDKNEALTKGIKDTLKLYLTKGTYTDETGKTLQVSDLLKQKGIKEEDLIKRYLNGELTDADKEVLMHLSEEEIKYLDEMKDGLIENNEAILQLIADYGENMRNAVEAAYEKMQEAAKPIERAQKLYDHLNNLIDTIGSKVLGVSDDFMRNLDDKMVTNANLALDAAVNNKKSIEAKLASLREAMQSESVRGNEALLKEYEKTEKLLVQELDEATDNVYEKLEAAAAAIAAKFQHEVDRQTKQTLNEMAQQSGYSSWTELKEEMEYANKAADRYVAQYKEIYELSKLNRDINKSIDETDNVRNKQRLRDLQKEINQLEEKSGQISQYELDNARRRYELELARLELEEAGNIKDTVRLSKDSEGNWSYVYTASEEDVAAAEQNYEDKLYAMQEANAQYIRELQELQIQEAEEYAAKLAEIMSDESRTIEERKQAAERLTGAFGEQMQYLGEQGEIVLKENKRLYDEDWTWYSEFSTKKNEFEDAYTADQQQRYGYRLGDAEQYCDTWQETFLGAHSTGYNGAMSLANAWAGDAEACQGRVSAAADQYVSDVAAALSTAGYDIEVHGGVISGFAEQAEQDMDDVEQKAIEAAGKVAELATTTTDSFKTLLDQGEKWAAQYAQTMQTIIDKNDLVIGSILDVDEALSNLENNHAVDEESQQTIQDNQQPSGGGHQQAQTPQADSGRAATWDRVYEVYNLINRGTVDNEPVRTPKLQALGYTDEEIRLGQNLINLTYPPSLHGHGLSMDAAKRQLGFDTGGYTGDWFGDGGRLALLHSKELVLNKDDTENILSAVDMVRKLASVIEIGAKISEYSLGNLSAQSGAFSGQQIEQTITINAEFPNATDHSEIEQAFNNLINEATQYANRKNF